jgi:hypothetical protein
MGKKTIIITSILSIIFVATLIFSIAFLPNIVQNLISDNIVLTADQMNVWGESPGSTSSHTLRMITFHNFTNPRAYLYHNKTPIFHEVSGYIY